jgi:methyl-accepting chemotaxis protein
VVSHAVVAMEEINVSSKKIVDITAVINEIAFQTNLLALNAAVEAARAGEQGRGFAVVASEVRNLSVRCGTAAKEISELIGDSVKKVENGARLVNDSGQTLEDIVAQVKKVSDIISDISTASDQQALGVEEVNRAVVAMDTMTQQNADLVQQSLAAGERVRGSVSELANVMVFFGGGGARPAVKPKSVATVARASVPAQREAPVVAPAPVAAPPKVAAVTHGDDEWEEF